MPAPTQPTPSLQPPTSLASHPLEAGSASLDSLPTLPSSSVRQSQAAVGAAYKLSSDGRTVRRLKGLLPIAIKGQSVTLINPLTQTPVQSFTLSPSDQLCTSPIVVLRSGSSSKFARTTYFGVRSTHSTAAQDARKTEIWAFTEELSAKGKGTADGAIRKDVAVVDGSVALLHVLSSGHLVATSQDGSIALLEHAFARDDDVARSSTAAAHSFKVKQTVKSGVSDAQALLHVALLDSTAAKALVASSSQIEEGTLQGLRIAFSSDASAPSSGSEQANKNSKKKNKRGRKSAIEVIDEAEGQASTGRLAPRGEVTLSISALLRSIDEAADSRLRSITLGSVAVSEIGDASDLLDVQLHADGRLVALTRSGELISATLSFATGHAVLSQWRRLQVCNLAKSSGDAHPAAVLALSRDHVLLVSVVGQKAAGDVSKGQKDRVVALLFDLEVEAVLAEVDWAAPAGSQSRLGVPPTLSLSRVAGSMAVVQLDPPLAIASSSGDDTGPSRINVLGLPFVVPDYSVLRHAMGKGDLTRAWTSLGAPSDARAAAANGTRSDASFNASVASQSELGNLTPRQRELVDTLKSIAGSGAKSRGSQMEVAFDAWMTQEKAAVAKGRASEAAIKAGSNLDHADDDIDTILAKVEAAAAPKTGRSGRGGRSAKEPEVELPYNFVSAVLPLVLPEATKAGASMPYARKIVRHLLVRHAVSSLMLSGASAVSSASSSKRAGDGGSLLGRLRLQSDWTAIMLAVRNVPDVSELDLVLLLIEVLQSDKSKLVASANNSTADVKGKPPSLVDFLAAFVSISVSRPLLRGTLKSRIRNVDDVAVLLQVLKVWLDAAARVPLEGGAKLPARVPSMDLVLPFATDLLDTYLPLLISTPSTHSLLRGMSKTIQLHLSGLNSLITLGAPLSAFAKLEQEKRLESLRLAAASRAAAATHVGPGGAAASAGNAKVAAGGKGAAAARAETGGGLGIGLGTEGVQKTRRAEAREESMLVGAYSLERLEI